MSLIYLDTNVVMDFLLDRDTAAYPLVRKAIGCAYTFAVSDVVLRELRHHELEQPALQFIGFCEACGKIRVAYANAHDREQAREFVEQGLTHYADALHAAIALRIGASCVVTRNVRDFIGIKGLNVKRPDVM